MYSWRTLFGKKHINRINYDYFYRKGRQSTGTSEYQATQILDFGTLFTTRECSSHTFQLLELLGLARTLTFQPLGHLCTATPVVGLTYTRGHFRNEILEILRVLAAFQGAILLTLRDHVSGFYFLDTAFRRSILRVLSVLT